MHTYIHTYIHLYVYTYIEGAGEGTIVAVDAAALDQLVQALEGAYQILKSTLNGVSVCVYTPHSVCMCIYKYIHTLNKVCLCVFICIYIGKANAGLQASQDQCEQLNEILVRCFMVE